MKKHQQGITLIETMISMVLSLGLIAGIGSLFQQMQKSNKVQRAYSTMADESNYVLEVIQKEIRRTGGLRSRSDVNGQRDRIFLGSPVDTLHDNALGSTIDFIQGEYLKGDSTLPTNDEFVLRYQLIDDGDLSAAGASNGNSPCTQNVLLDAGEDPGSQVHVVTVHFKLNGALTCSAQRETVATDTDIATCVKNCTSTNDFTPDPDPAVAPPVQLINNLVRFAVAYGVDSDATPDNAANYYVPADVVETLSFPPANGWQRVVSLRLSFIIKSEEDNLTDNPMSVPFNGGTYTPSSSDHHLYKAFSTTIALRNLLL